jgi:hypothetical protein
MTDEALQQLKPRFSGTAELDAARVMLEQIPGMNARTAQHVGCAISQRKSGYSGEGKHRFRREAERRSRAKVNSSRSEPTLAW